MASTAATGTASSGAKGELAFAALIKYWRGLRGLSQLDLSLAADVSARHISFLETGRSRPSMEMVAVLAETLDVPMRETNELLRVAGFEPIYPEPTIKTLLQGSLGEAVQIMLDHHEPYPMMVFDRLYNVVRTNRSAELLLAIADITLDTETDPGSPEHVDVNLLRLLFDPASREMIGNWPEAARAILRRLQREVFHRPYDEAMADLLADLLNTPGIPADWRTPVLEEVAEPTLSLEFQAGDVSLRFLTTITEFNAPQNVTLQELRIESFFPLDDPTRELCQALLV